MQYSTVLYGTVLYSTRTSPDSRLPAKKKAHIPGKNHMLTAVRISSPYCTVQYCIQYCTVQYCTVQLHNRNTGAGSINSSEIDPRSCKTSRITRTSYDSRPPTVPKKRPTFLARTIC